ncbi:EF-hand domain-containing protein [Streptosporangium soli]|nr:EF-hand domain-containing protein [Streptosporangium sp. KLBMP 9127]
MFAAAGPPHRKICELFDAVDADRDGYVEWADYQRLIDRYLSGYHLCRDDRRAMALQTAYALYWQELERHADGGRRVDKDAFAIAHCLVNLGRTFQALNGIIHAVLDITDTTHGYQIGAEKFARLLQVLGITAPAAVELFARLDTNGDGRIGCEEFARAAREFFVSGDPDAPGGLLFGVL